MRAEADDDFLQRLNVDLPAGVDWKQGAVTYLRELVADGGEDTERFHLTKPFQGGPDFAPFWVDVFQFLDVIHAVDLPSRSRILDVGCGPGWTVHWLAKLGHDVIGLDISAELLDIAEQRMRSDPHTPFVGQPFTYDLRVHDIEAAPLHLDRPVDLALFESTLHHFYDPVSALRNTALDLADTGLLAVIEASAPPVGSIWHDQNVELMRRYHTIERPYTRDQLYEMLDLAGLSFVEFFRPVNRLYRQHVDALNEITNELTRTDNINILIAGKTREAVARLVPSTVPLPEQRDGMRFLAGFSSREQRPDGSQYRWCGPRGLMAADGRGPHRVRVGNVMLGRKDRQVVYVLVDGRVSQRVEMTGQSPGTDIVIDVPAHTFVELQSDHVFSPAWQGLDDPRVLSFTVDDPVATP
ncbi:MAG: class I SAM-dependent methyltransferase [Actinomycetota bacterium]|nr:class I SAM-dependent methyltransferase [Actinomycetota bacterium]